MREIRIEWQPIKLAEVPRLKELLAPCPICGGTTDIMFPGYVVCFSCQQEWTILGEPITIPHSSN